MRLVTWNCYRGEARQRAAALECLNPDIVVLQECGEPTVVQDESCVWFGNRPIQGVGVVTRGDWRVSAGEVHPLVPDSAYPFHVRGPIEFNLLGVWTQRNPTHARALDNALDHYRDFLLERPSVVVGDFNDHPRWDSKDSQVNFSTLNRRLNSEFGLVSAFHGLHCDECEPATLYWQWRQNQPYHIDYCYVPQSWVPRLERVEVGGFDDWADQKSDHRPVLVELTHPE